MHHGLGFNWLSIGVNGALIGTGRNKRILYSEITEDKKTKRNMTSLQVTSSSQPYQ
jgi:hypothetical protein